MANFYNTNNKALISGTSDNDGVVNYGSNVTISTAKGNDTVENLYDNYEGYAEKVIIYTGDGNDSVYNEGDTVTVDTGAGNDSIDNHGDNVKILHKD